MQKFFRLQIGHFTLEEMQAFTSEDGGENWEEIGEEIPVGICACLSAAELLHNTVWGVSDAPDAEVVEFRGRKVADIYDGCRCEVVEVVRYWQPASFAAAAEAGEIEEEW